MSDGFIINIILPLSTGWLYLIYCIYKLPLRSWAANLLSKVNSNINRYNPVLKTPLYKFIIVFSILTYLFSFGLIGLTGWISFDHATRYTLKDGTLELWTGK